jgi:multidrug transporter EmrE-like cation transporter
LSTTDPPLERTAPVPAVRPWSTMTPFTIVLLLFAVVSSAGGQVLLKYGMAQTGGQGAVPLLRAATSPWVLGGLVVFGISALAWMLTLSSLPLNIAYPINALGYLVILTASVVLLGERSNVWTWVGTSTVVAGLLIVILSRPS